MPEWASLLWTPARHYALYGGRGGGKSWAIADHLLITAAEKTLRTGCAREIQNTIRDSVKRLLDDRVKALGLEDYYESTDKEIRCRRNDSIFIFKGLWRNPDGIRSMEGMDRVWVEEAARASQHSINVLVPTVRKEGSSIIWSWNPEYSHDPVDKMFRQSPPPNSIVRRVNWDDNPWFPEELRLDKDHMYETDPLRAEHVYGGEYIQEVDGAYYAASLLAARNEGRMTIVPRDPNFEIRTFWDLGRNDSTAIWVAQFVGERILILDYFEGQGQPPGYYMELLRRNGYAHCECVLPHDGAHIHADNPTSMSYERQLKEAGFRSKVIRNQGAGAAMQRIDATRRLFPRIWFNTENSSIRDGLKALGHYHEKIDEKRNVGLGPEHDWSSHAADAFGLMAIAYNPPKLKLSPKRLTSIFGTMA